MLRAAFAPVIRQARFSAPAFFHSSALNMGVTKEIIKAGDGVNFPKKGDKCRMHYVGTLTDGKKFDSSRDRGQPFETEGVPQMSLGEVARLTITGDYAYGPRGVPGLIPANATLVFEVELLKIN